MKLPNGKSLMTTMRVVGRIFNKHLPSILTGIGIGGMIVGTVVAIKATPDAHEEILSQDADEEEIAETMGREPKKDIWARIKIYAKYYWVSAVVTIASATCILFANNKHIKREAALAAAYGISSKNLEDLREKIKKIDGEKKFIKMQDEIAEDRMKETPESQTIVFGSGEHLFFDALSGRYFRTDIEKVKRAGINLCDQLLRDNYASLNDFYDELNWPHIELGNDLGWFAECKNDLPEIIFTSKISDSGEPCIILSYDIMPTGPGYGNTY